MRVAPVTGGTTVTAAHCLAANLALQALPCNPGDHISLAAWVRAQTTSRTITIGAQFFTAASVSLGIVALAGVADTSAGWTEISGLVAAPATAAYCRMTYSVATPASGEYHYIDDAYMAYAVQGIVACVGAGGAGGSSQGQQNGSGGGGGEIGWEVNLDLTPGGLHQYSIGKAGTPTSTGPNGNPGGDSWFQGMLTQVRGHGGGGGINAFGDYSSGVGGLGGLGSVNTFHYPGGAGQQGYYQNWEGGGGGGAAGDGGPGAVGTGGRNLPGVGGPAGSLGIAGGYGAAGYPGIPFGYGGDAGAGGKYPGGGGGASASNTANHTASPGANGMIQVTIKTYTGGGMFPALLVHKASPQSGLLAKQVIGIGNGADPPDGRQYTVDQVAGQNARFTSTYSVVLVAWSLDGTAARNVTVEFIQYISSGGNSYSTSLTGSVTPSLVLNGMITLGEVTLPVRDIPPENTDAYYAVSVTSADLADRFMDLILIDTMGQTFLISNNPPGYLNYWIDAPDGSSQVPGADLGRVLGSIADRASSASVLGNTMATGGPLRMEPGDNLLTVYSPSGQSAMEGDYWPRWWQERLS
jgi:hypothetical protein